MNRGGDERKKENEKISDSDLEIYIKHLDKLKEDFKARFDDLKNMHVPEWFANPFDVKLDNEGSEPGLEDELSELYLRAEAELFLLPFPTSYVVETGFNHLNAILTKQRNRLNLKNRDDLRLKLTNFQPNINILAASLRTHLFH
ncbi:SCAN domain-containing protein 3-like [Centruroides sculpturatus]|uniref:SCAN domain-containing protein 3-like n=1 Tax=Centruroides sculpturatus TaxID=218467 RepID=UPI000C6CA4B6|nr:SCAN domain-containing protein 3-like [Centruroides sculpturatus]